MAVPSSPPRRGAIRRIPFLCLDGRWQMAIDEWLLDRAVAGGPAAFRLYRWSRPTLSLGFHQRRLEPHWLGLAAAGEIELVRRPSGGRAVLHGADLTYALIWPDPPAGRSEAYRLACGWLRQAFAGIGLPLHFGMASAGRSLSSCFACGTAADLVHAGGAKRIGSAQLRRQGCLLQHGSIQLAPPPGLWRAVFLQDPPALPPLAVSPAQLQQQLARAAELHLSLSGAAGQAAEACPDWLDDPLTGQEWTAIRRRRGRYRVAAEEGPGGGDTSPERTIAWAT